MRVGLIAKKVGMSRFYDSTGLNHPVTILEVENCQIVEVKTIEKNGYNSVRLSTGLSKNTNKPFKGFLKKNNLSAFKLSKEFLVSDPNSYKIGNKILVNNFMEGQFVDVSANSIGKGFAGGMKRHNFAGNRATHGVSISHRSHGSTGQCQDPGKVFKGKKMAGRLGNKKVTIQNLKVLKIDLDNNIILVKGAVPGHKGSMISVFDSVKKKQEIKSDKNDVEISSKTNEQEIPQESKNTEKNDLPLDSKEIQTENSNPDKIALSKPNTSKEKEEKMKR